MEKNFQPRRVVTGIDPKTGKSHIVSDGPPPKNIMMDFWTTTSMDQHNVSIPQDNCIDDRQTSGISPPPQGTKFRFFTIAPKAPSKFSKESILARAKNAFKSMGTEHEHLGTTENPGM